LYFYKIFFPNKNNIAKIVKTTVEVIFYMKKNVFNMTKLTGKNFVITLLVCLAVVAAAGIYSYNKIADKLENQLKNNDSGTLSAEVTEPVNNEQKDIPKETEAETKNAIAETTVIEAAAPVAQTMVRPLNGKVINGFSGGELVKSKTLNVWKTHDGVDISGNLDEKVKSMTSGTVMSVKEDPIWGICVIIDHGNGVEGHYYNLSKDVTVTEGMEVAAGTVIGAVGDTAQCEIAEDPHLHFAVKENGEWVDPVAFLSAQGS
jgi:murein DD-endopeptidase MepM/ murein hydrolase activator NlpD